MKRFSLEGGDYVKNEMDVSFDILDLDMSAYIHDKAPKQSARYTLYAVTVRFLKCSKVRLYVRIIFLESRWSTK